MAQLERVVDALGDGDYEGALQLLLAAWSASRDGALAETIVAVGARVTAQLPPLPARSQRDALAAAIALWRQRRASDVDRLLADLRAAFATGRTANVVPRLDELGQQPPDPRIALALVGLLQTPPQLESGSGEKAWLRLVRALVVHADPRHAGAIEAALVALGESHAVNSYARHEVQRRLRAELGNLGDALARATTSD